MSEKNQADKMWQQACFLTRLVSSAVRISEGAGNLIRAVKESGQLNVVNKEGAEDVQTEADRKAQYFIDKSLKMKFSERLNIIGEEHNVTLVDHQEMSFDASVLEHDSKCADELRQIREEDVVIWVDPLDGTAGFKDAVVAKTEENLDEVTVLIGIAYKNEAIAGVVHQPFYKGNKGRTIWGIRGIGAFGYTKPELNNTNRLVVTSRSHFSERVESTMDALRTNGLMTHMEKVGGAGYKVLRCLEGANAYVYASSGCKKWDTAAPEAVLEAAGGKLRDISGRRLCYGADVQFNNSGGVLAVAPGVNINAYLDIIPENVKKQLPEETRGMPTNADRL